MNWTKFYRTLNISFFWKMQQVLTLITGCENLFSHIMQKMVHQTMMYSILLECCLKRNRAIFWFLAAFPYYLNFLGDLSIYILTNRGYKISLRQCGHCALQYSQEVTVFQGTLWKVTYKLTAWTWQTLYLWSSSVNRSIHCNMPHSADLWCDKTANHT